MRELDVGITLTPKDHDLLAEMAAWYVSRVRNAPGRQEPEHLDRAPDVYIGRAPADGIPAFVPEAGTGTGTVGWASYAVVTCYRVEDGYRNFGTGTGSAFVRTMAYQLPVYNLSNEAITEGTLILVVRDADGHWTAIPFEGGSGGGSGEGDQVSVTEPAGDGAAPPKPKLMSHREVDYQLSDDSIVPTGLKMWMRDANA